MNIPILTAIVGFVAIYVWRGKRTKDAKDSFGVFICEHLAILPETGVRTFYDRTKPDIRLATKRIWHFLSESERIRMDRLWSEYDQIQPEELDPKNEGPMGEMFNRMHRLWGVEEFQSPHQVIKFYLDEFYKFSA